MSTQVGEIHFDLDLDHRKFSQGVKSVEGDTDKLDGSLGRSKGHAAALAAGLAVAGAAAVAFAGSCVKAFMESESMIAQTNAVIKSTGGVAGVTAKDVTNLATGLQKSTAFSDEQVRSAENMALTFTGIHKDIFPEVTKTALDMATALNHGITPSGEEAADTMKLLGKALQDPDAGLGALKRVGVNVEELKKQFTEGMTVQEKQKLILQELGTEFGGSAAAAAATFSGRMQKLKNTFNDVQEKIGELIAKGLVVAYEYITKHVIPVMKKLGEKVKEYWDKWIYPALHAFGTMFKAIWDNFIYPIVQKIIKWWDGLSDKTKKTFKTIALVFAGIVAAIMFPVVAIIAFISWLVKLYKENETFRRIVNGVWKAVSTYIKSVWNDIIKPIWDVLYWYIVNILIPQFKIIWSVISWVWDKVSAAIKWAWENVIKPTWDFVYAYVTDVLIPMWQKIWDVVQPVWQKIWEAIQLAWENIKVVWEAIKNYWENTLKPLWNTIAGSIKTVWDGIVSTVKGAIDNIKEFIQGIIDKVQAFIDKVKEIAGAVKNAPGKVVDKISDIFRADGGPVSGGRSYIVGEQGPELFTPSGSGTIIPNHELAKSTGGASGGGNVYLSIDASGIMATSRAHQRQVISTLIEAANEELIGRGIAPIAENKLRAAV